MQLTGLLVILKKKGFEKAFFKVKKDSSVTVLNHSNVSTDSKVLLMITVSYNWSQVLARDLYF